MSTRLPHGCLTAASRPCFAPRVFNDLARLSIRPSKQNRLKGSSLSEYKPVHNAVVTLRLIDLKDRS